MTTWRRDVSLVLVLLLVATIYVVVERWQRAPGTRWSCMHRPIRPDRGGSRLPWS